LDARLIAALGNERCDLVTLAGSPQLDHLLEGNTGRAKKVDLGSMMKNLIALLLVLPALAQADAATDAELGQLKGWLLEIQRDQLSLFQQAQMVQVLRDIDVEAMNPTVVVNSTVFDIDKQNFDELERVKEERMERVVRYTEDLDRIRARYGELEGQKGELNVRIKELAPATSQ
jgi:hypothetical protein